MSNRESDISMRERLIHWLADQLEYHMVGSVREERPPEQDLIPGIDDAERSQAPGQPIDPEALTPFYREHASIMAEHDISLASLIIEHFQASDALIRKAKALESK